MIYGRLIHEACARFGYWPMIVLVIYFGSIMGYQGYQKKTIEESEKQLALDACVTTDSAKDCSDLIEKHHGACFDFNFAGGDFYGTPRLDRRAYRACLAVGLDQYATELRQSEAATRALQYELLN